jgi:hypothetical protein
MGSCANEQLPAHHATVHKSAACRPLYEHSLLPQDCGLTGIPSRLRPASALRRLRIDDEGAGLRMVPGTLKTLSALSSLTFLSITQAPLCNNYARNGRVSAQHLLISQLSVSTHVIKSYWA